MKITQMRIGGVKEPLGFTSENVSLSWKAEDAGEAKKMAKANVRVTKEDGSVIYEAESTNPASCLDFALPITVCARSVYHVSLVVTADNGEKAEEETSFETGKDGEAWEGKWITSTLGDDIPPVLYKTFTAAGNGKRDRLYISGLGVYEAYLNGVKIGNEYLAPGYHSYDFHVQDQTYDLAGLLKEGTNELAVYLADGWFRGRLGFEGGYKNLYGDRCAAIAELWSDDKLLVKTDDTWQCVASPMKESSIYDGEVYDARMEKVMTEDPAARTGASSVRLETPERIGTLSDRYSLPIVKKETFEITETFYTPKQETVLDFAQNLTGWVEFDAKIPEGEKIVLTASEIMQDDCFYHDNFRTARTEFTYISDGTGRHVRPHFTFFGFRYMKAERFAADGTKIEGEPAKILNGITNILAIHLRSDFDETGSIKTGNAKVDRLFLNALWGQKDNFLDVPTDCPQRDERLGWTGDAQVFSETACYNMDVAAFYRKYLWDMKAEMTITDGATPNVVPRIKRDQIAECGNCPWADVAVVIPWNVYRHYGSKSLLKEFYPVMKGWVDFSEKRESAEGAPHLIKSGFHFADWLALDNPNPGPFGATDPFFIASAYYYQDTNRVAEAAKILGYEEDAVKYEKLASEILEAIQEKYFDENGLCVCHTQTGTALSLMFGLIPERGDRDAQGEVLDGLVRENNMHLNTGFVGTPILCPALTESGHSDTAMSLLLNEEYPGWLNTVNLGATTIWERWNSVGQDGHLSPEGMNSLNHYSYGSIEAWMYGYTAGIKPAEPGFLKAKIEPHADARLGSVDCSLDTAAGTYRSEWHVGEDGKISYTVEIPFNAEADVTIGGITKTLDAGVYHFEE